MRKLSSFRIFLLLVSWLFVQTSAFAHEYSHEHISGAPQHHCLSQSIGFDDLIPESSSKLELTLSLEQVAIEQCYTKPVVIRFQPQSPRAPPLL